MPDSDRAYNRFLRALAEDRATGSERAPSEYAAAFSGAAVRIAEFFASEGDEVAPTVAAPPPVRMGPYRLERLLGRGAQGSVHLAIDERLGRPVALKVLTASYSDDPEAAARFRREAELASRLDHPGLCAVYEAGEADGAPYLAMRYVEGRTLASFAAERKRTPPTDVSVRRARLAESLRIVEAAARALHSAHERGVIHRDVKPGNVILEPSGRPVVVDFGLARLAGAGTQVTATGVGVGTPAYLAPEQMDLPSDAIDRRADVYALGVMLYELVAGAPPFSGPNAESILRAVLFHEPSALDAVEPEASPDLATVVAVAMAKDRSDRFATAEDFADDIARVAADEPIRARRPSVTRRLSLWYRRRRALAHVSLVALIVALVAAFALRRAGENAEVAEISSLLDAVERVPEASFAASGERTPRIEDVDRQLAVYERAALAAPRIGARADELLRRFEADPAAFDGASASELRRLVGAQTFEAEKIDDPPSASHRASLSFRRRFLADVRVKSTTRFASEWERAVREISDPSIAPRYGGFRLAPQPGLLPLRLNDAGLYEFLDLWSLADPFVDPPRTIEAGVAPPALVFILVPADGDGAAFLLSKYELTLRIGSRAVSRWPDWSDASERAPEARRDAPASESSAADARRFCARLFCRLPSESEWLQAAALGSDTPPPAPSVLVPVAAIPPDAAGFCGLFGHVDEWVERRGLPPVLRGGSVAEGTPESFRASVREPMHEAAVRFGGVRPARSLFH